jgi:hypothetical protein
MVAQLSGQSRKRLSMKIPSRFCIHGSGLARLAERSRHLAQTHLRQLRTREKLHETESLVARLLEVMCKNGLRIARRQQLKVSAQARSSPAMLGRLHVQEHPPADGLYR